MGGDLLRIVEAAYAPEPDTQAWLDGILEAARPFDTGGGVCCYVLDVDDAGVPTFGCHACHNVDYDALTRHQRKMPADVVRRLHAPAARLLYSGSDLPKLLRACQSSIPEMEALLEIRVPWMEIAIGGDHRHVLALGFFAPDRKKRLPVRTRRLFPMVLAHLGAAARLRARQTEAVDDAWLSPSGGVLEARGAAGEPAHRRLLANAVRDLERARGSLRRTSPEEALGMWQGMVQAEWSLVDTVERDGKRFILARRNPPEVPHNGALTSLERTVAYFAALGHAQKFIGYELGISEAAVADYLRNALFKLGLRSRIDLTRVYAPGAS